MDPTAALKAMTEAIQDQDWTEAQATAQGLLDWLARGGFPPAGRTREEARSLARDTFRQATAEARRERAQG